MSRTTVDRILRIVFLAWLIVTAALIWQTVHRPARSVPDVRRNLASGANRETLVQTSGLEPGFGQRILGICEQ